jgi:hypothetical protein
MGHRCTIRSQVSLALAIAFASAAIAPAGLARTEAPHKHEAARGG